jgi:hypothetical protein
MITFYYVSFSCLTTLSVLRLYIVDETIINESGADAEMKIDRGNLHTGRKHVLVSFCSPENVHL